MEDAFFTLAESLCTRLHGAEVLTLALAGEDSDFVRFNQGRVRQAGHVRQDSLSLHLIDGGRHASLEYELQHHPDRDLEQLARGLGGLRALLPELPEDPHLLYATEVYNSHHRDLRTPPDARTAAMEICGAADGLDLVGILASGRIRQGFANSLGQRNWHENVSFNLDWSCYADGDKAVKADYAGTDWSAEELRRRLSAMRADLAIVARSPHRIEPGDYRVYLAPCALREILDMMAWDGFGLKAHRSAETPLIKMVREGAHLSPQLTLAENAVEGIAPRFTDEGFVRPERVILIENGRYRDCLVGPRSAREFGFPVTGGEYPESLSMDPGTLPREAVLQTLDRGLLVNNLWYCNFSDHNDCRITGMTRFGCFWVEDGEIQSPVEVMRFDDSIYRMLGSELIDLTRERDLIIDSNTYDARSSASYRLPGALIGALRFTL